MKALETPFLGLWWGIDLGEARPCDGTYCGYAYESLPPLDMSLFKGEFQWLGELSEERKAQLAVYQRPEAREGLKKSLETVQEEAKKLLLSLPPEFVKWMGSLELQDQIPSSTACYFSLGEKLVASPVHDGSFLLRFYNDQQDVLLWYLYLKANGDHAVVASPIDEAELSVVEKEDFQKETFFCGESFKSFLYRLWIENKIWFGLDEGAEMDEAQKAYLAHYKKSI